MPRPPCPTLPAAYRRYLEIRDSPEDPDSGPVDWRAETRDLAAGILAAGSVTFDADGFMIVASVDEFTGCLRFDPVLASNPEAAAH